MSTRVCYRFRPDHNGECLDCDEWFDAHPRPVDRTLQLQVCYFRTLLWCSQTIVLDLPPLDPGPPWADPKDQFLWEMFGLSLLRILSDARGGTS